MLSKLLAGCVLSGAMLLAALPALAQPRSTGETVNPASTQGAVGAPDGPRDARLTTSTTPDNPESAAHKKKAMDLVAGDPVLSKAYQFSCTPSRYNDPGPVLQPAKVFDNLYAIPSSPIQQTTVWAITTSAGIILIDAGYPGSTETILGNLRKVGLDPAQVKYILLGHGHGDHYAAALYFQERYGAHVGAAAPDWDLMHRPPAPGAPVAADAPPPPKRDLVLKEGEAVKLGDQTVDVIEIPGHTPGSLAFIFNVREGRATHTAGLFGGTVLDQPRITTPGLNQYLGSIDHYLGFAKQRKVDVEIQNHALFDDTPGRLTRLAARRPGEPNPFVMTTDRYANLWTLMQECIRSEIARRPAGSR